MEKGIKWVLFFYGLFLGCVLLLFGWLYFYSSTNIEKNAINTVKGQLAHAEYLLDTEIREVELSAISVLSENKVLFFEDNVPKTKKDYEYLLNYRDLRSFLINKVQNAKGMETIAVYWPESKTLISSQETVIDQLSFYEKLPREGWFTDKDRLFFVTSYPYSYLTTEVDLLEEPSFYAIIEMNRYYLEEIRQTLMFHEQSRSLLLLPHGISISRLERIDHEILQDVLANGMKNSSGNIKIDEDKYTYFSSYNEKSKVQLLTYIQVSRLMAPVETIGTITLIASTILLGLAIFFVVLFYRSILLQIDRLVLYFKKVESGDFTTRIVEQPKNEFGYVFNQFNQMVAGGQVLLESLFKEQKMRDRSEFKQLQLQIDPHFLYNSLSYIVSVSDNQEAVIQMSSHLAYYFRYRTNAKVETTLARELQFAESYLEIMSMRKELVYTIDFPEEIMQEKILPLIIQPLIENAIEHGIEGKEGAFQIYVVGEVFDDEVIISVSDDGKGLTVQEIEELMARVQRSSIEEKQSIGLWNINQRLKNHYGKNAQLHFKRNELEGLTVRFKLKKGRE